MKYVVFSDIHGNRLAFEAMMQEIKKFNVDGYIFCGDIMGYFMHQKSIIKQLYQLPNLHAVMGNHDYYYLKSINDINQRKEYAVKYGKSYLNNLSSLERKYLKGLPEFIDIICAGKRILITHGSSKNYLEGRIYPDTEIDEASFYLYDIVFLGHTHYQMYRKVGNTIFINPGSLGQPRDFKGYSYCIADINTAEYIFRKVHIDQNVLIDELVENNEEKHLIKYIKSKMEEII